MPNKANKTGNFPVYSALAFGLSTTPELKANKIKIYKRLAEIEPSLVNAINQYKENILHLMAGNNLDELIKELLEKNSQLAFQKSADAGKCPIHVAILNKRVNAVNEFLKVTGMMDVKDDEVGNLLHFAAAYGNKEIMEACCAASADKNVRDDSERTALMIAAEYKNKDTFDVLVAAGADPSLTDAQGYTLLHHAVHGQNQQIITWVLDNTGININIADKQGNTPLKCLLDDDSLEPGVELVNFLKGKGAMVAHVNTIQ